MFMCLFAVLSKCYVSFYVKKRKLDNFMCLLEFECAKRLKAHSHAIPEVMAKVKTNGRIWTLEFNRYVCFLFHGNRTIFGWDIANFYIWPWKFKVKVMAKVKTDGHIWAIEFNWYVCFSFRGNQTIFGWDIANSIFDLENARSKSWPRSNLMVTFEP